MYACIDADAFFASVLQRKNRSLLGKSILVMGMGGGCVIAASYEAKAKGVRTGMRLSEARKLAPEALEVLADFDEACVASDQLEHILRSECPAVQQMSVDEWFVNLRACVGGIPQQLDAWAQNMHTRMYRETGLTVSIGIASTLTLAKMGSAYRKPAGITIVSAEEGKHRLSAEQFLTSLAPGAIPGIGPRRQNHTAVQGWKTAWDFTQAPEQLITSLFGKNGHELWNELRENSVYKVSEYDRPPKSISRCRSFHPTNDPSLLRAHALIHLTRTVVKMRRHGFGCKRLSLWIRDHRYEHISSDRSLPQVLKTEDQLLPYLESCLRSVCRNTRQYTQVGLCLSDFSTTQCVQYSLFDEPKAMDETESMQESLDTIRSRFGRDTVVRGSALVFATEKRQKTPTMFGDIGTVS